MSQFLGATIDLRRVGDISTEAAATYIRAAQSMLERDRARGFTALNELFASGGVPDPAPHGRYRGQFLALNLAPGITQVAEAIARRWMPWLGKTFDASEQRGDNIFRRDSLWLAHIYWPLYRRYRPDRSSSYRAFDFRTYTGAGLVDNDLQLLKIDYDLPVNPYLSVRRVLDEIVELADGFYLGKAHLKRWIGGWQTVAYFTLAKE